MKRSLVLAMCAAFALAVQVLPAAATPPSDVEITVETSLLGDPSPFIASGAAVDEGIVCAAGFVTDPAGQRTGTASPIGLNYQGIKQFTCDDGSGEFFINLQGRIVYGSGVGSFYWNVLRGTGDYAKLHGAGSGTGLFGEPCGDPEVCVLDLYFGGFHND